LEALHLVLSVIQTTPLVSVLASSIPLIKCAPNVTGSANLAWEQPQTAKNATPDQNFVVGIAPTCACAAGYVQVGS
jgi:hypothetical protein